jgi:putative transposase
MHSCRVGETPRLQDILQTAFNIKQGESRGIVTDKLISYNVARRELITNIDHNSRQYANNKTELSHQVTRVRERGMRKFKSVS